MSVSHVSLTFTRIETEVKTSIHLQAKAKDMVDLAGRIRTKLNADASKGAEAVEEKQEMQDFLLSVGIASPVTRNTAGALYHQQLARQASIRINMTSKISYLFALCLQCWQ